MLMKGGVGEAMVIRGDALHLPLADASVDLVISSPPERPYYALRAYQTGHEMEVGSEPSPQAYLEALWAATREMKRVLKPTGSIWINLGDKYSGAGPQNAPGRLSSVGNSKHWQQVSPGRNGIPEKSLMGLPWRYAIGCIDQLGLILRRDLIWDKPNGLPESVTDRPRSSHEYWFMFVKQPRYFAALDELREPHARDWRGEKGLIGMNPWATEAGRNDARRLGPPEPNPLGKLPGSVWSIPSEPLRLPPWIDTAHYAAFPTEWPRRLILGFTPHLVCGVCGVGRFPVVDRRYLSNEHDGRDRHALDAVAGRNRTTNRWGDGTEATIVGYGCACTPFTDHPGTGEPSGPGHNRPDSPLAEDGYGNVGQGWGGKGGYSDRPKVGPWREYHLDRFVPPPGRPAVVADVFGGTGTVAHVAHALGRHAISIDLSEPYCRLAADTSLGSLARQRAAKVAGRVHLERQGSLL